MKATSMYAIAAISSLVSMSSQTNILEQIEDRK